MGTEVKLTLHFAAIKTLNLCVTSTSSFLLTLHFAAIKTSFNNKERNCKAD